MDAGVHLAALLGAVLLLSIAGAQQSPCPPLPDILNGFITTDDNDLGTVGTYGCNAGFVLDLSLGGSKMRTCVGGIWNNLEPSCISKRQCPVLAPIPNGAISYGPDMMADFDVGTLATYSCDRGFVLFGSETQLCIGGGIWSKEPPECQHTVTIYKCVDVYEEGSANRTCQEEGMFDGEKPLCVFNLIIPVCVELDPLVNGGIDYDCGKEPFSLGTVATYSCNTGYALNGLRNKTCMKSDDGTGEFDPPQTPTCVPICDAISAPPNSRVTYNTDPVPPFSAGALAMFECVEGFSPVTTTPGQPTTFPLPNEREILLECGEIIQGRGGVFVRKGTSSQVELNCTRDCVELPAIPNGMISYAPDMTANYSAGTVATYKCDNGFELAPRVGNLMRTCVPVEQMSDAASSRSEFDGVEPICKRTCTIADPMLVSPFTRSTSYTFMGTCEHALLQSCDDLLDFMVRTDFITDSMDNGAVGVFVDGVSFISREDGTFETSGDLTGISRVPGRETQVFANSDVEVERGATYTEIRVGGGIGVNVYHNFGDPSLITVTVSNGTSLGETCGLCGTQGGYLRRTDGSIADITDRAQVEAFTMDYLTPADQQSLRPIRRECSTIRNDTILGYTVYTAALTKTNGGPSNLCYEVRGSNNQNYNLISDECVSVNALYQAMEDPELGNIIVSIGVRASTNDGRCFNILVEREGCRLYVLASDRFTPTIEINSTLVTGGISVRRLSNRVRISVPNCDQVTLVMWVRCVTRGGQDMLDFSVSRGTNLRPTSHGLLGQFWNIPVSSSPIRSSFYTVNVNPDDSSARSFTALVYNLTWDERPKPELCLYAGNIQGGPSNELQDPSLPADSVIQGSFRDYQTTGLFVTQWTYSQFSSIPCFARGR